VKHAPAARDYSQPITNFHSAHFDLTGALDEVWGVLLNFHRSGDGDGVCYIFNQLKKSSTVAAANSTQAS
jgi:hypothetical protein